MPKTPVTLSPVEVVTPGQPSEATLAKLKTAGARLQDRDIIAAVDRAEANRIAFGSTAILAGALLLSKRLSLKHGQWLPYLQDLSKIVSSKGAARCQFAEGKAERSMRVYVFLAQHFIADLEQQALRGEMPDEAAPAPAVTAEEVLLFDHLPQDRRMAIGGALEQFVAGRSLRRMLSDLRRADNAAHQEEAEQPATARTRRVHGGDDQDDTLLPPIPLDGEQLELWHDVARPLHALDTLIRDRGSLFKRTDRTFWNATIQALEARLSAAKAALKEIA
jgi:hypothetical protein